MSEPKLYKRLRGARWSVLGRDPTGRQRELALGERDEAAAELRRAELEVRFRRGEDVFAPSGNSKSERFARLDDPLALAVEEYLVERQGFLSPGGFVRACGRLRRFAAAFAGRSPARLSRADCAGYLARLARTRAPGTHNQALFELRQFGAWLVQRRRAGENPAAGLPLLPLVERVPDFLTLAERERVLAAAAGRPGEALLVAALGSGLRRGELDRLAWGDLHLAPGAAWLLVRVAKGRRPRTVPLPDWARARLVELRPARARPGTRLGLARETDLEALRAASGIARLTWRLCRSTFASLLIQAGVELGLISAWLGHRDPKLTVRRYAALAPGWHPEIERAARPGGPEATRAQSAGEKTE